MKQIRYTQGPDTLSLGDLGLVLGEWSAPVANEVAEQALLPARVAEFGFESKDIADDQPAAPAKRSKALATADEVTA